MQVQVQDSASGEAINMANLQSTRINDTGFLTLPQGSGGAGTQGQLRFNAAKEAMEYYTTQQGGLWTATVQPYLTRTVLTTGYLHGGYAASAVWNNTNRCVFATDTTTNLGDNSQEAAHNYQSAACNTRRAFTWGASNSHCVAASNVICFDMRTEQPITSGYTRTWPYAHINNGTLYQEEFTAWVTSSYGSTAIYEWNLTTETLGTQQGSCGGNWGTSHENYGIFYGGSNTFNFTFSTRTNVVRPGTAVSGDGYQHTMPFKNTMHYGGREGNPSTNWRQTNMLTNTSTDGSLGAKPNVSGEENHMMAQDWGYCLGFYNGTHVNTSYRMNYAVWAGYSTPSTTEPKGKVGTSSATMTWRS